MEVKRSELSEIIRRYSRISKVKIPYLYGMLYGEYSRRYGVDIRQEAQQEHKRPLDYLEKHCQIERAMHIAKEIFQ